MTLEFKPFPKIARLSREVIVTEKIDGTNACIGITEDGDIYAGSRSKWLTPKDDNFGFARWVADNGTDLLKLGPGTHFGEWWGSGIQRGYGLPKGEKRFSLFNVTRWADDRVRPWCCNVVPVLAMASGLDTLNVAGVMNTLRVDGSLAAPGFKNPEGIVIYHAQGNVAFKKTFEKDDDGKGREPVGETLT